MSPLCARDLTRTAIVQGFIVVVSLTQNVLQASFLRVSPCKVSLPDLPNQVTPLCQGQMKHERQKGDVNILVYKKHNGRTTNLCWFSQDCPGFSTGQPVTLEILQSWVNQPGWAPYTVISSCSPGIRQSEMGRFAVTQG